MAWRAAALILGTATVVACGSGVAGTDDESPRVASITVGPAGITLVSLEMTHQFTATVSDQNGNLMTGVTVSWSSSAPSIANVNRTGIVTAVSNGSATITASSNGVSGTVLVIVAQAVATVTVTPSTVSLTVPATRQMAAEARDARGNAIADKQFSWTTSTVTVASVTTTGLVTAVGSGTATISATADGVVGTATVAVSEASVTVEVTPPFPALTAVGQKVQLTATVRGASGAVIPGAVVTWSSSNCSNVATVNNSGLVTAVANGVCVIRATESSGAFATATVTVSVSGSQNVLVWEREMESGAYFNGIWGSSASDVYAIGVTFGQPSHGIIWRNDGTGWSRQTLDGTGRTLFGVWGSSATNMFIVGAATGNGPAVRTLVLRYDGVSWASALDQVGEPLYAVWGSSPTDVFAVGRRGTILRFNGASWTAQQSGTTSDLRGVWGTSSTNVFAVGDDGTILHYNGTNWIARASGTMADLEGVWGTSSSNVYAAGGLDPNLPFPSAGVIVRFNGTDWTPQHVGTQGFTSVWGTSATDVFAVGSDPSYNPSRPTVYHFDGTSWSLQLGGGDDQALRGVWGSSSADVYAVSQDSRILHYDGSDWTAETLWRSAFLSGLSGTSATHLHAAGAGSIEYGGRQTGTKILRGSGTGWRTAYLGATDVQFSGTWGTSPTNVFAVGGKPEFGGNGTGLILRYDGSSWQTQLSGTATYLLAAWGSSATDVFAVGFGGTIVHYDGTSWTQQNSGTTQTLASVWGTSSTNVFAVGVNGTILRYNGVSWTHTVSGTTAALNGIWGSSATDIFAVGANGVIRRFNGTTWSPQTSGSTRGLVAIWGTSSTNVFAVGEVGTILHFDGTTWRPQDSGTLLNLSSIWGSSPTDVWVTGWSFQGPINPSSIFHGTPAGSTAKARTWR